MSSSGNALLVNVVDDDGAVRDSPRWLPESSGYRVTTNSSAECFLLDYKPRAAVCLILDVRRPRMSGLELQQELKDRGDTLPIIFISGDRRVSAAVEAIKNGACDFVEKPASDDLLLSLLGLSASSKNGLGTGR